MCGPCGRMTIVDHMSTPGRRQTTLTTDAHHNIQHLAWRLSMASGQRITLSQAADLATTITNQHTDEYLKQAVTRYLA